MIAYNKTWLRNIDIVKKAKRWYAQNLLNDEQFAATILKYPSNFYSPNLFIKIGLFLFTWIAISATLGVYALMFSSAFDSPAALPVTAVLYALASVALLEIFISNSRIYHSGTDEALLYSGLIATGIAVAGLFNYDIETQGRALLYSLLMLPFLFTAVLRYADRLVAFLLSLFCYAIFFLLVMKVGAMAKLIMPFAFMILSLGFYFKARQMKQLDRFFYWKDCIVVFECVALLMFYISGNYYVIRELSIEFFEMSLKPGQDIPLAFVFYIFTAGVPLVYVFFGLKRKDKILLWIGLVLIAAAVLTFKYYFSLGHPEITLTTAGIIMILVAYVSIKYLKIPKYGITFEEEADEDNFLKTNAEALLVAQSFSRGSTELPEQTEGFGGGQSGGGGAGGGF
ncbi:MAG: hypothetical protein WC716_03790 [Chitinophagaceae bacterium]|jgi:hypothetical protein